MTEIREFAPAKINLYLHVTGRRPDGFHDLDSLVAFASIGDEIIIRPSQELSFQIIGPQTGSLRDEKIADNLVIKAAQSLASLTRNSLNFHITLFKNLPVASGIGGGSSDAAAVLRALSVFWGLDKSDPSILQAAALHGQDVPVCMRHENVYMTASGVIPAPQLPHAHVVLINPNKALPTPAVFKEFKAGCDQFSELARLSRPPRDLNELVSDLKQRTNDLYGPATRLMPEIATIAQCLERTKDCLLVRMSGSGATCFAVYPDRMSAHRAAEELRFSHATWWIEAGEINGS